MSRSDGGHAYPAFTELYIGPPDENGNPTPVFYPVSGMSLRDAAALAALQALATQFRWSATDTAKEAFAYADAFIAERESRYANQ